MNEQTYKMSFWHIFIRQLLLMAIIGGGSYLFIVLSNYSFNPNWIELLSIFIILFLFDIIIINIFRTRLKDDGITGYTSWGKTIFISWTDIIIVRFRRMGIMRFKYLSIENKAHKKILLPCFLKNFNDFKKQTSSLIPNDNPLFEILNNLRGL